MSFKLRWVLVDNYNFQIKITGTPPPEAGLYFWHLSHFTFQGYSHFMFHLVTLRFGDVHRRTSDFGVACLRDVRRLLPLSHFTFQGYSHIRFHAWL